MDPIRLQHMLWRIDALTQHPHTHYKTIIFNFLITEHLKNKFQLKRHMVHMFQRNLNLRLLTCRNVFKNRIKAIHIIIRSYKRYYQTKLAALLKIQQHYKQWKAVTTPLQILNLQKSTLVNQLNVTKQELSNKITEFQNIEQIVCPITRTFPTNPVFNAIDGRIYDKSAIETWIKKNHTSPLTREKLTTKDLVPMKLLPHETLKKLCMPTTHNYSGYRCKLSVPTTNVQNKRKTSYY